MLKQPLVGIDQGKNEKGPKKTDNFPKKPKWNTILLLALGIVCIGLLLMSKEKEFIIVKDGEAELAPWRKEKLEKELKEIDEAEQYVLRAKRNGLYPCFNCGGDQTIYLLAGEVWKYGVTRKGEKIRYSNWHVTQGLLYFIEFEGTLAECVKEEKRKIYFYALLPENLKRDRPLIRPPGNKNDS